MRNGGLRIHRSEIIGTEVKACPEGDEWDNRRGVVTGICETYDDSQYDYDVEIMFANGDVLDGCSTQCLMLISPLEQLAVTLDDE